MRIDEDGAWTTAAYLVDDVAFESTQHGMDRRATLCGIPESEVELVRSPFWGRGANDCPRCAARLAEFAAQHQGPRPKR